MNKSVYYVLTVRNIIARLSRRHTLFIRDEKLRKNEQNGTSRAGNKYVV